MRIVKHFRRASTFMLVYTTPASIFFFIFPVVVFNQYIYLYILNVSLLLLFDSETCFLFQFQERDFDMHANYCWNEARAQQLLREGPLKEYFDVSANNRMCILEVELISSRFHHTQNKLL